MVFTITTGRGKTWAMATLASIHIFSWHYSSLTFSQGSVLCQQFPKNYPRVAGREDIYGDL